MAAAMLGCRMARAGDPQLLIARFQAAASAEFQQGATAANYAQRRLHCLATWVVRMPRLGCQVRKGSTQRGSSLGRPLAIQEQLTHRTAHISMSVETAPGSHRRGGRDSRA